MKKFLHFLLQFAICNLQFTFFILSGVVLMSLSNQAHAQSPQSFNYQLIARDTAGLVLSNRTLGIQISILKDAFNGNVVYSEQHTATANNYGLVNLSIGTGSVVFGSFEPIDWGIHTHYIKLEIDPAGSTNYSTMGTTQLVSVPYSLYAAKAGNVVDTSNSNELQALSISNDTVFLSNGGFVKLPAGLWSQNGNNIYNNNTGNVGIGINAPAGKLIVKGDSTALPTEPLFEVKNSDGDPVFVVYPDSVRITFTQSSASKATAQGGFAVSGRSSSKGATSNYLVITPDSSRIYLEESSGKGNAQGGFAVSGRSSSKGTSTDYLNVSVDTNETIIQSQPRILWYPTKEAFLTGRVLIQSPDSVGTNSFASGFESKAIGNKSQALGHQSIARGEFSTAIGKNAIANSLNSYAFGDGAKALNEDSYAFGAFTEARGIGSFAFGYVGRDSVGPTGHVTKASGNYSFAFGLGSQALNVGAIAIGAEDTASGLYSLALGYKTKATSYYATSIGNNTTASAYCSVAMGYSTKASGAFSTSFGYNTMAQGDYSIATGSSSIAGGRYSFASGKDCYTSGVCAFAFGLGDTATGYQCFAAGLGTKALNNYATAFGKYSVASGQSSFVTGQQTEASADCAVAMGRYTRATKSGATALGYNTLASGSESLAGGSYTSAKSYYSVSFGYYTIARPYASFVIGQYNDTTSASSSSWNTSDPLFICGNGTSNAARSNAFTILKNGNTGIGTAAPSAKLEVNGTTILGGTTVIGTQGTVITNVIKQTVTVDLPSIAADGYSSVSFTVTNAAVGSTVYISPEIDLTNGLIICWARVSAANTVRVKFKNTSTGAIDMASMDWYITVIE